MQFVNRPSVQGIKSHLGARCCLLNLSFWSSIVSLSLGGGLFIDWHHDNSVLRQKAIEITGNARLPSSRIVAINNWVSDIRGVPKNTGYFALAAFGPTPLQILKHGGDCADKSRLVAAMLNELGLEAGLIMIRSCSDCAFGHTVVEARYERGRMVIDPLWGIDYPAGDGRYFGIGELAWTNRGARRLAELRSGRGPTNRVSMMPTRDAIFDYAVGINWSKSFAIMAIADLMRLTGYHPKTMLRPRFLEGPKLALTYLLILMGLVLAIPSIATAGFRIANRLRRGNERQC